MTRNISAARPGRWPPVVYGRVVKAQQDLPTRSQPGMSRGPSAVPDSPAPTPAGVQDLYRQVRLGFGTFIRSYFRAVETVLRARGPDGRIDPAANRAAFDAAVASALEVLAAGIITETWAGPHPAPARIAAIRRAIVKLIFDVAGPLSRPLPERQEGPDPTVSSPAAIWRPTC
jgi:hypothetical protein